MPALVRVGKGGGRQEADRGFRRVFHGQDQACSSDDQFMPHPQPLLQSLVQAPAPGGGQFAECAGAPAGVGADGDVSVNGALLLDQLGGVLVQTAVVLKHSVSG